MRVSIDCGTRSANPFSFSVMENCEKKDSTGWQGDKKDSCHQPFHWPSEYEKDKEDKRKFGDAFAHCEYEDLPSRFMMERSL